MKCLIDADILRYEIGHSGQYKNEEGEEHIREWSFVQDLLENKIRVMKEVCESDEDPILYLTNDTITCKIYNRWLKTHGYTPKVLKPNFRYGLATVRAYKSTRSSEKPFHYANLTAYMLEHYHCEVANGCEADDLMAMDQVFYMDGACVKSDGKFIETIICSRDKDLRQVEGWHYSWECGQYQPSIGPIEFSKKGFIEERKKGKCFGGGEMFFLYQLLVGDPVDTIPGCPGMGHVKTMALLKQCNTRKVCYKAILACYSEVYGKQALDHLNEQGRLLWLLRSPEDVWEYPYDE